MIHQSPLPHKNAESQGIKLNVGAGPIWSKTGWFVLDHKAIRSNAKVIAGTAKNIDLQNEICSTIFCSHVFEHIPHIQLPLILDEFHRVLKQDGILRILTPDLKKIATAYVNEDKNFFKQACSEDENIRTDLGLGGSFMNFIVSPGQDTALFNRNLDNFISGYGHLYSYDFEMLKILLENSGFKNIEYKAFCESSFVEFHEPLHVNSLPPIWEDMNATFYEKHKLIHYYDEQDKKYHINFTLTGFDRDPVTSLIIECRRGDKDNKNHIGKNYNKYGQSLLGEELFSRRYKKLLEIIAAENMA
ncbi:MAG: methyltransferase domain-containing protein [Bacteroidales bacterium]|jgi:SAM-dependent methyltransferase|nr:methyltransferase domain-containing protein [Bacteroidales bacterium]